MSISKLVKGKVKSFNAGAGTAKVEVVGSHGRWITVPVATDLDSKTVVAGKLCVMVAFDENDEGDAVLVATYDDVFLMGSAPLDDHDHTGDTGDGGQISHDAALTGVSIDDHHAQAHAAEHQNAGGDEISVADLSGLLADGQTPVDHDHTGDAGDGAQISHDTALTGISTDDHHAQAHAAEHQNAGADEISVADLSGLLADGQTPVDHDHTGDAGDGAQILHDTALTGISTDDHHAQAHTAEHQNAGADEISVADLSGLLADGQTPVDHDHTGDAGDGAQISHDTALTGISTDDHHAQAPHAAEHQNAGGDEISVADLSGLLADGQTPLAHAASHQNAGGDEVSVADLSGLLADGQTPLAHAASHQNAGGDEVSVADLSGLLADGQTPIDHDHSGDAGDGGQLEADDALILTGGTTGDVLTVQADDSIDAETPAPPGWELIAEVDLSGGDGAIAFTSIPATYTHLWLVGSLKSNYGTTDGDHIFCRMNSESGASDYAWAWIEPYMVDIAQEGDNADAEAWAGEIETIRAGNDGWSAFEMHVPDYANTNKTASWMSRQSVFLDYTSNEDCRWVQASGVLRGSAAAISQINFYVDDGSNFEQHSKMSLFGVK